MTTGNGQRQRTQLEQVQVTAGLPPPREAVVEQGLRIHQETAAERDDLRRRLAEREADIAGFKVAIEALQAQLADADSQVATMRLVRDEAVGRRAEVETILSTMLAIGRAFRINSTPVITGGDHDPVDFDRSDDPERSG